MTPRPPWLQTSWGESLTCILVPLALLAAGVFLDRPPAAAVAAAAALVVGFGVFKKICGSARVAMTLAAVGTAFSTLAGTLAGHSEITLIAAALLWGFGAGLIAVLKNDLGWVAQQCTIMLLVAGAFPGPLEQSAQRTLLVLGGSALQVLVVGTLRWLSGHRLVAVRPNELMTAGRQTAATLMAEIRTFSPGVRRALRLAAILAAAVAVWRGLGLPNGYWMAMTALLLVRPNLRATSAVAAERIAGTVAGAILATLITHETPAAGSPWGRAFLAGGFATLAVLTLPKNQAPGQSSGRPGRYALFASCLTAYVVFLLDYAGLSLRVVTLNRVMLTLCGGAFALLMHVPVEWLFSPVARGSARTPQLPSEHG